MSAIVESIDLTPIGAIDGALPVKITRGIKTLHIESRNPPVKNNLPLDAVKLHDDAFGLDRIPVVRLSAEQGGAWMEWTFKADDKEKLQNLLMVKG